MRCNRFNLKQPSQFSLWILLKAGKRLLMSQDQSACRRINTSASRTATGMDI
jgi:hypothetical protein